MSEVLLPQSQIVRCGVAVIVRLDRRVLFIKRGRSHQAGTWSVPGGWMDFGEEPAQAAAREVLEEVGLDVCVYRETGYTDDVFHKDGKHCITLWFDAVPVNRTRPIVNEDEVAEWRWVDPLAEGIPTPRFLPLENRLRIAGSL